MKLKSPWLIPAHGKVRLSDLPTDASGADTSSPKHKGSKHKDRDEALKGYRERLAALQEVLYAGQTRAVLIVLQGMDTAGKDGTISHIFSGVNPQGCEVSSFKVPTPLEARHDFLWRCHAKVPAKGMIGIFNRSHYEQVLSPRVHKLITGKQAHRSMDEINDFEQMLSESGTTILKFFLNISRDEQTARLQARLDDPDKHWKLSAGDFQERKFWDSYQECYADILDRTSKAHAPWFAIPANHKGFRNLAISEILVEVLTELKLHYPKPSVEASALSLD